MIHNNDIGYYLRILRVTCVKPLVPHTIRRLEKQKSVNASNKSQNVRKSEESKVSDENQLMINSIENSPEASNSSPNSSILNIESKYFAIVAHNTLHGPFYPVKRAIEEFMEREEWNEDEEQKWRFLCAETIVVLAKDENDISKKIENTLFSNRHNVLLVPRVYYVIRVYFDTSLVPRRGSILTKAKSLEKEFKLISNKQRSLPQYKSLEYTSADLMKNKISYSVSCVLM